MNIMRMVYFHIYTKLNPNVKLPVQISIMLHVFLRVDN